MITVSAKNLGPLVEGTVELKPLTIFVGTSNTGKSYMAAAIWAAMQVFGWNAPRRGMLLPPRWSRRSRRPRMSSEDSLLIESVFKWVRALGDEPPDFPEVTLERLPDDIRIVLEQSTRQMLEGIRSDIVRQLRETYGRDSEFSRNGKTEEFKLAIRRDRPLLDFDIELTPKSQVKLDLDMSDFPVPSPSSELSEMVNPSNHEYAHYLASDYLEDLSIAAGDNALVGFPADSYLLPAARSGIAQGHKILAAEFLRRSRRIGLESINIPTLPRISAEFLSNLLAMDRRRSIPDELADAIHFIQINVLHGSVDLDESDGLPLPEIVYLPGYPGPPTGKFNLEHTSSMVSELAPVVLFLKYLVHPGDLLIFEEPESHMHPATQLQMARGIARLVNAGVSMLVTTHSGDFVEQVNNLLRMSKADTATTSQLGLADDDCLRPDRVGAYGFRMHDTLNGSVIYPLPVASDVGIEDQEFLPVAENLYEQAIALQNNRLE